ncbi:MAG TPA: transglycosylase domain-containing protein [Polyangiaceae bacterium]|nr:transglycosylase domain-containing protein [Polyangiaceae bacterium]
MRSFNELLQSPRALKALVAGGSVLSLLIIGLLASPALVRGKVEREARERGFEAQVGSVHFGWSGVWLRDVRVTSPGDQVELRLDAVNLGVFSDSVRASGGSLRGRGDPEPLWTKLRGKGGSGRGGQQRGRELDVDGLFVSWQRDGVDLTVFGARATRRGPELGMGADLARLHGGKLTLELRGLSLGSASNDGHRRLSRVETKAVELSWTSDEIAVATAPETAKNSPRGPPEDGSSRAARLRELRAVVGPLLREGLALDAELALDGVSARIERAGERLSFGPSRLSMQRDAEQVRLSLTPNASEAKVTPLALNVSLPLGAGPVHVVAKGGPVSLQSLGVRAGQLGLRDVKQATLAADGMADFSEDFESVSLDGKLSLHGLVLERKELSPQPVGPWSLDIALKARARLDGTELEVTSSEAHVGELRAELSGVVAETPERRHIQGRLRVPLSGCQSMLAAMPRGLLPLVRDMRLDGSFGIDLQARYDSQTPKDTSVVLKVQNECRVQSVPAELQPQKFERAFLREIKAPDGSAVTQEFGPGTAGWVPLDDMSRHLETAVLICEDSRFHAHAGFDFKALENAIKDDLKAGRFARGASTVSMQLAKNLYLGMEKTLGRKLQEALLTMLLEQQLDKRRILELYLNVVELGPGLYGVGDAAQYYFATPARSLSLGQALYLASILPNPSYSRFGPDGRLNASWRNYLQRLVQIAHKIKRIDDVELQVALEEEIAFRVPGPSATVPVVAEGGTETPEQPPRELDQAVPGGP